jgi:CheY-like chemotaxis protein
VTLHGGTIDAFSAGANTGATFTVRLPSTQAVLADDHILERAPGRRMRVLLVDDNTDSREMYAMVLQADGHEVHEADDSHAALAAFQAAIPDVAVIDIGLPGMDGYDLARRIRSEPAWRDVTLIALTGYGFPEDRARSRAAGFDRHLVKPAAPEDLRQELTNVGQAPRRL